MQAYGLAVRRLTAVKTVVILCGRSGAKEGHFWLLDSTTECYFDLSRTRTFAPIGLEHFYDAFGIEAKRCLKTAATTALSIPEEDIGVDLSLSRTAAGRFPFTPKAASC